MSRVARRLVVVITIVCWLSPGGSVNTVAAGDCPEIVPGLAVWVASGMAKIRPETPGRNVASIKLQAAKNEFELAHLVITAGPSALTDVDVTVSDLVQGDERIDKANIRLYREQFLDVQKRSNVQGEAGRWPDPLIPKKDLYYGESRDGFPFTVDARSSQPVLVEVYVPLAAQAGVYRGSLQVYLDECDIRSIPLAVEVFDFTIPSISSLQTSYSVSLLGVSKGFTKGVGYHELEVFEKVMESLLLHRISPRVATWYNAEPYQQKSTGLEVDWSDFDEYFGPFFEGTALDRFGMLPGARFTTWNILADTLPPEVVIDYADSQVAHFKERGWPQFLYRKVFDEPNESYYPQVHSDLDKWLTMKNKVPLMVTTGDVDEFVGKVRLWCEVMNFVHRYDDASARGKRDREFAERMAAGETFWWYQSCNSTGCFVDGTPPIHTGWPNMAIDFPGIYQRIMPWITWKYEVEGELYYDVTASWYIWDGVDGSTNDPWINFDHFRLNGDGRLFYPGTVDKIGGTHPIPIESLRLKMVRDGYEDYEYFALMQKYGKKSEVDALVDKVVSRANNWQTDPDLLGSIRQDIARFLEGEVVQP